MRLNSKISTSNWNSFRWDQCLFMTTWRPLNIVRRRWWKIKSISLRQSTVHQIPKRRMESINMSSRSRGLGTKMSWIRCSWPLLPFKSNTGKSMSKTPITSTGLKESESTKKRSNGRIWMWLISTWCMTWSCSKFGKNNLDHQRWYFEWERRIRSIYILPIAITTSPLIRIMCFLWIRQNRQRLRNSWPRMFRDGVTLNTFAPFIKSFRLKKTKRRRTDSWLNLSVLMLSMRGPISGWTTSKALEVPC